MQTHNSCGLCSITLKDIQVVSGQDTLLDNINLQFHCGELTALILSLIHISDPRDYAASRMPSSA